MAKGSGASRGGKTSQITVQAKNVTMSDSEYGTISKAFAKIDGYEPDDVYFNKSSQTLVIDTGYKAYGDSYTKRYELERNASGRFDITSYGSSSQWHKAIQAREFMAMMDKLPDSIKSKIKRVSIQQKYD